MSTLRVSAVNNAAASVGGLAIDSSGNVTGALPAGGRQLLYNGAMQVSQRGTSTTGKTTGSYITADRWYFEPASLGTWTETIENDAPTGSGFRRSLKVLCTTADAAPAAGDLAWLTYGAEGQDVQRIRKGTSSAQKLTLSFWVKSNRTGTYIVELQDADNTRSVSASYSIAAGDSGNWVRQKITFPADTTGAFDNNNDLSLKLAFWLGAGSTYTSGTLATTWAATTNANRAVGQTNLAAATNNYWQVTGVQLEVGDVATDFEFKSFGQELRECQRYYYRQTASAAGSIFGGGLVYATTSAFAQTTFPTIMRTSPTAVEQSGTASDYRLFNSAGSGVTCSAVPVFNRANPWSGYVDFTVASGLTAGNFTSAHSAGTTAYLGWSAEL